MRLLVISIYFLFLKISLAQYDGSFWWLNKDLNKYRLEPPQPQFEELNEFDTDESAKIVFRDNDLFTHSDTVLKPEKGNIGQEKSKNDKLQIAIVFQDQSAIAWPNNIDHDKVFNKESVDTDIKQFVTKDIINGTTTKNDDILDFKFPSEDEFWKSIGGDNTIAITPITTTEKTSNKVTFINDITPLLVHKDVETEAEHICTPMKKNECSRRGGTVYLHREREQKKLSLGSQKICCILPITDSNSHSKIHFIETPKPNKRLKRSNTENPGLRQRNALLLKKYGPTNQALKSKPATVDKNEKIVAPADNYDPYWNIKNSNSKAPVSRFPTQSTTTYDDSVEDYVDDYVVEIPQPGLVGLYSDHSSTPPNWSFVGSKPNSPYGGTVDSEENDGSSFVYPVTVDPRLEDRTSRPPIRRRPVNFATTSEEKYDFESQTISYQSNPDFHVLEGFKLLNLARNKSRIYRNERKTTTTESVYSDEKESSIITASLETDYGDFDKDQQVYKECGRAARQLADYGDGKDIGDAESGSHPWLALIVLSKRQQRILCYATIVTPKAAITAADCVHGKTSPGEVTLIAGVLDIGDNGREGWQKRLVSIHIHPEYTPGELAHDLALLHWKRPLSLGVMVQPACLSDPHVGDECKFFGWGGFDQAIRQHSRWQRASILTPRACHDKVSPSNRADLPSDAFCASVQTRGTVTGIGAPLMCNVGSRYSAVGVAIWRDHVVILIPAQEWTTRTLSALNLF